MRILCFGDSNTYGYDPRDFWGGRYSADDRWPELLAKQAGWEVVNAGVNGREIPRNPDMVRWVDAYTGIDVLIIMLGTNDLLQGASVQVAADRMGSFLKQMIPLYDSVFLVAPPPMTRGAWVPTDELVADSVLLSEQYKALAEMLNISFVDTRDWNIELTFDGVHFTEKGHHTFAAQVFTCLSQKLFPMFEEKNTAVLKYDFLEHYYIAPKDRYEKILCECLNRSDILREIAGGYFEQEIIQNKGQPDVYVPSSGYALDFKLMISKSLAEFRSLSSSSMVEVFPGVRIHQAGKKIQQKVVLFPNAIRNITEDQLREYRQEKDIVSKAITHLFDNILSTPKHILLFLPLYISTSDEMLSSALQLEQSRKEFSNTLEYIYTYRKSNHPDLDTFFVYILKNIPERECYFVITQFTETGLKTLESVDMFSLKTVRKIHDEFLY